ncbi:MAG: hypothetical protein DRN15_02640 [Thermoprotei archaeon]|nr:MAG: hypothetical protein DRM97_05835 [Thermoprotei archaeon]RLF24569.1 MAG: hypothetical protein DRN15_02640 [Thermoprotei archaeon]
MGVVVLGFYAMTTLVLPPPPPGNEGSTDKWGLPEGPIEEYPSPPYPRTGPPSGPYAILVLEVEGLKENTNVLICARREDGFEICFNIVKEGRSYHKLWLLDEKSYMRYDIWVKSDEYKAEPSSYSIKVKAGDQVVLKFKLSTSQL